VCSWSKGKNSVEHEKHPGGDLNTHTPDFTFMYATSVTENTRRLPVGSEFPKLATVAPHR